MTALVQFSAVNCGRISQLSYALEAGTAGVVRVPGREEKALLIDLAVGERQPESGTITLDGVALDAVPSGSIGWVPDGGGLISNLKTWENVTLPVWYHRDRRVAETEARIAEWLAALGVVEDAMEAFMASPAARLTPLERKRAGLLRGLLLAPRLLVVDGALFGGVPQDVAASWVAALEAFTRAEAAGSVLVAAAEGDFAMPWKTMTPWETITTR